MTDLSLAERVKAKFPNLVIEACALVTFGDSHRKAVTVTESAKSDQMIIVKKEGIKNICLALKNDAEFQFNMLMDLTAVDYLFWEEKALRFEVIYNLFSLDLNHRLFVKVGVAESETTIDSVVSIWPAANWFEREVWDMFGIQFKGHPNLKRILMYEEFEGHPLRKDYPYNKRQPLIGPMN